MSQRRTLILVAAILIGALSSFLVWNYVNNVQDEALDNAQQVPVYLVKQTIPRGVSGLEAQAYIAKENIPKKFKPANAISSPEDLAGKVSLNELVVNQVVVNDMFVEASDPAARQSFTERLNKINNTDQTAVSISVDQVRGVAGLIEPGDFVNVMITQVTQNGPDGNPVGVPEGGNAADVLFSQQARYLYQKAEVLAIDQEALPRAGATASADPAADGTDAAAPAAEAQNRGLITLIVPVDAAQYIVSVQPESIYLTLVAPDYKPVPQAPIDPGSQLPAEDPNVLTPYGKEGPEAGA